MQRLYILQPEVGGDWGPNTVVENRAQIEADVEFVPRISFLEYRFNVWLGDDIVAGDACYIISQNLAASIIASNASGVTIESVDISTEPLFFETLETLLPERSFPQFSRMIPEGSVQYDKNGKLLDWSGHDASLGVNIDFVFNRGVEDVVAVSPYDLVVTEHLLSIIEKHRALNCDITEITF